MVTMAQATVEAMGQSQVQQAAAQSKKAASYIARQVLMSPACSARSTVPRALGKVAQPVRPQRMVFLSDGKAEFLLLALRE